MIITLFFVIGLQHTLNAQSIEILDNILDIEVTIKNKFLSFQENTIANTCIGIDSVDQKNKRIHLANKTLSQLMYWRYEVVTSEIDEMKSIASISSYTSKDEFTSLGKRLFDLGVINTIIK